MTKQMPEKQYYFFNVSYAFQFPGGTQFFAHIMRAEVTKITAMDLATFKQQAKVPEQATLLSISPLGRMTQEEFNPAPAQPVQPSKEYLEGFEEGLYGVDDDKLCPYPNESLAAVDYMSGSIAGRAMRTKKEGKPSSEPQKEG